MSAVAGKQQLTVRDALNMALDEELARDERVSPEPGPAQTGDDDDNSFLPRSLSWERRWLSMTELTR